MRPPLHALLVPAFLAILGAGARAQGADDCSAATLIAGTGTFAVSTVGATDGTQQPTTCPTIHRDVWFRWTAASTQGMSVSTCGGASADTVLAVWPGPACPAAGTQPACNDDACGTQSTLFFSATAGTTYLIQVGAWAANTSFSGTFALQSGSNPCTNPATGPDVIVGDITSVQNSTAANGLDSVTVGTTSCNVGTATVNWFGPTALHPVISEALYKYRIVAGAGRFEQIGTSWLKHGFASDAGSLCCTCQNPGNNQILGVGCSDPYSASQAGAQSGLTPRWQVNAHTGVFPYPGANPAWSGSTARRCEVELAELEPSTATTRYFMEAAYTTQDDAQAGNNNNNESYKEMVVTGTATNYTFATTGSTQRMRAAIEAWPVLEPGVTLSSVQIPGDGLFMVGSHATSLGGGLYHYEFAVHDMNSDRACGSFSVPVPAGATITNIGFHDVTYRNGDGVGSISQTSTDWAGAVQGGAVVWACETQAQNGNANAIRWQSTYNFRFDADVGPTAGLVSFGLWKPGSPASMTAPAEVPTAGTTTFGFCYGDGAGTPCPCGNDGAPGSQAGCLNSLGQGGALTATGIASVSTDTFVLVGAGMPGSSALYFQGTSQAGGGAGTVFGDGLRCAGGTVVRLGTKTNSGGGSQYPDTGDPAVSVRGSDVAGDVRTYQCWYRNAASFCQPDTFNLTNGVQTTWQL